jgi:hypothetical protein
MPFPFNAPFVFYPFQLLHSPYFFTHALLHLSNNNTHLFFLLPSYSLCTHFTVYAQCFCILFMSSALPVHHRNSSASLAIKPTRPTSLGVTLRFLSLSGRCDSSSSLAQSRLTSLLQSQASTLFQLSITSMASPHSTGRFLQTLPLLWKLHRSIFHTFGRNHQ